MADEAKPIEPPAEPSIGDMRKMLSEEPKSEPVPAANDLAPKPAAEPAKPAEESKPATPPAEPAKAAEQPVGDKPPEPGTGKETQEQGGEKKGKFEPKGKADPETQKEINRAVWRKHQLERDAEAKQKELEELDRKLAEKKAQASGKPATGEPEKPATSFTEAEPNFDDDSKYPGGQYDPAFVKDLASWQYRKDRSADLAANAERRQKEQAEEQKRKTDESRQKASEGWNERVAKTAEKSPEIAEAIANVGEFLTQAGAADLIMQSEVGPEIVLYLHRHPEDTMTIASTGNPIVIAREIGRIEARLSQAASPPAPKTTTEPTKPLPEPVAAVGGGASPPAGVDLGDPKISMADFKKEARRQLEAAQG